MAGMVYYSTLNGKDVALVDGKSIRKCMDFQEELQKLGEYEAIESRLEGMFKGTISLETVVDALKRSITEPDNPLPMNARILTYEESAEYDRYLAAKKEIEEKSGKSLDAVKLVQYFLETVFEGEKHERFCILTNEDVEKWEEYQKLNEHH